MACFQGSLNVGAEYASQKNVNLSSWAKLQRAGALRGFFAQGLGALRSLRVIGFRGSGFSLGLSFKGL